jgi:hypothetical protein
MRYGKFSSFVSFVTNMREAVVHYGRRFDRLADRGHLAVNGRMAFGMLPQIKVPPFCKHGVVVDPVDDGLDFVPDQCELSS